MIPSYAQIERAAQARHLSIRGAFHPSDLDGVQTLILLGPDEPAFWPAFKASPEYQDGAPDPMDRWSERVIRDLAKPLNTKAVFPFGGPPHAPFFRWARDSGRAHHSPINLLVHDQAGLFISYRGGLAFAERLDLPDARHAAPCTDCGAPCLHACPVGAFANGRYDVALCKSYLTTPRGQECLTQGCAARRACPISQRFGRLPEQSAFHMRAFL